MTQEKSTPGRLVSLSLAVPGWQGNLIPEAVEKVARGVALEQERLRGSRFLVVLRRYELDYDGVTEWIEFVSGYADVESAVARAQIVGAQRLVEMGRRLDSERKWKHAVPKAMPWPKVAPVWEGKRLPVFVDRLWDGVGWNAAEVAVAIIPTNPDNPINLGVVEAIDLMWETASWFMDVADEQGGQAQERDTTI
jgi:hypothetical protein